MTKNTNLDGMLGGIQIALFEVRWPAFPWMTEIYCRVDQEFGLIRFAVLSASTPAVGERADCERLLAEIASVAIQRDSPECEISFVQKRLGLSPADLLMSQEIFELLAKKHSPQRLKLGR